MSSETSLPWLVKNKPSAPIRRLENKVEFLERQFQSEKLSFVHKKETEHSFELSLSICVFYRRIFNLEMQNFCLGNHHIMIARQPFCSQMTFTKVSNPFLSSPAKWLTWPDIFLPDLFACFFSCRNQSGKSVRTYVDAITKFSRMDSLPSLKFIRLLRVVFSSQQRRYWGSNNDSKYSDEILAIVYQILLPMVLR